MAAELGFEASFGRAASDLPISINAVQRFAGERAGSAARGAKEGTFAVIADGGSGEIFIDEGFKFVMCRHLVARPSEIGYLIQHKSLI